MRTFRIGLKYIGNRILTIGTKSLSSAFFCQVKLKTISCRENARHRCIGTSHHLLSYSLGIRRYDRDVRRFLQRNFVAYRSSPNNFCFVSDNVVIVFFAIFLISGQSLQCTALIVLIGTINLNNRGGVVPLGMLKVCETK